MSDQRKRRVLFVCMGNICRSPTGEGVMKHLVKQRGFDERVDVDSAGTIDYHQGEKADARMRKAASKHGYKLTSRARQMGPEDIDRFDLIIAMDQRNLSYARGLGGASLKHVRLLSDYLEGDWPIDVPDPYYGGEDGFTFVIQMIEAACPAILDALLAMDDAGQGDGR